jgi:ribosome-binding factor A
MMDLGDIFQKQASRFGGGMITVTKVKITPDLSLARIMLSIFGVEDKQKVLQKITSEKSEIRFELGKRIKNQLRKVPELAFFLDDSLDYIERIDQLLDE